MRFVALFLGLAGGFWIYSCSATPSDVGATSPVSTMADGGSGGGGGASQDAGAGAGGDGNVCLNTCSDDLSQVLDCRGAVLATCDGSWRCANAECADPCAALPLDYGTAGCEFYSVAPVPSASATGACFAAIVVNGGPSPVLIDVSYDGLDLEFDTFARIPIGSGVGMTYEVLPDGTLPPGGVAVLFLSREVTGGQRSVPCPEGTGVGVEWDTSVPYDGLAHAFRIRTSGPVQAYDFFPYGGSVSYLSSATLLVPTRRWGTNYVAADGYPKDDSVPGLPFVQIVAKESTKVSVVPSTDIDPLFGFPATPAGQVMNFDLEDGDVLQFAQVSELAGSIIVSDRPIGVFGGSSCMNIPIGTGSCDGGHQQLFPVSALGHDYVATSFRERISGTPEIVPYTFVGVAEGTTLTYLPATPPGAPTALSLGTVARFDGSAPFVVSSQDASHPFYLAAHMTGCGSLPNNPNYKGDPEYVNVVPVGQHLSAYTFFTDPTYSDTNLVFARKRPDGGAFEDVVLDCVGTISGWQSIDAADQFEYARIDLVVDGVPQGACENGVRTATSSAPFSLTVWGWDEAVSYAYPAGAGTEVINELVVPVPR